MFHFRLTFQAVAVIASLCSQACLAAPDPSPVEIADAAANERGDRSEVLVLGTAHLSYLPADFDRTRFDPLLARLAAWAPQAIAVEAMSGAQCDYLRTYAFAYPTVAENYCFDPAPARKALGLTGPEAEKAYSEILAQPAQDRAPEARRRLAGLFLAAGEADSALVQWLRLPAAERHADASLPQVLVDLLGKRMASRNENATIAAPLAVRLGLERVFPVDDHTGEAATGPVDDKVYGEDMGKVWDNPTVKERAAEHERWEKSIADGGPLIDWYRALNSLESQRAAVKSDFAAAAGSKLPGNSGRAYLAYWETRNLRMAANIREVVGPGRRVLAIVGASHKPYYERYLGMTSDIEIGDVGAVLGD